MRQVFLCRGDMEMVTWPQPHARARRLRGECGGLLKMNDGLPEPCGGLIGMKEGALRSATMEAEILDDFRYE